MKVSNDYLIADHRIRVQGLPLVYAVQNLRGFNKFQVESHGEPICRFVSAEDKSLPEISSEFQLLYSDSKDGFKSSFVKKEAGIYYFDSSSEKGDRIVFESNIFTGVTVFYGDYTEDLLRFALWLAYGLATLHTLTVSLHASSVTYNDKVVLFLGESGTGKSTHSRLWLNHIQGAELFNDDSPILRVINGKIIAYGSPWSGKTACYRNESYPLAACVRLSQAPYNKITRMTSVATAFTALHPSCPPEFAYDDQLYDYVSDFLSDFVATVPVYRMEALPDDAAAEMSCETVFGECKTK